ncbi:FMN-dependent NADH-azoreductase [Spiroplasma endosymbiont of Labia minor]|uniref:FMN-dependent NADH-azoreductase n=1 Tax=Spiroplasma endosymbiont of Labia minor TaxID=3066305 RepID=UPI0030D6109C
MSKILVLHATLSEKEKSYSFAALEKFIEIYKKKNPNDEFTIIDLEEEKMAKTSLTRENLANYWNDIDSDKYINQLKSVDKLIIACAMNNFTITTAMKNYIDRTFVSNKVFTYKYQTKGASKGLLDHLTVQIIAAQGAPKGWYPWGDITAYLKGTWEFAGAKVKEPIMIGGTKVEPLKDMSTKEAINTFTKELTAKAEEF